MFSQASVILFTGGRFVADTPLGRHTPPGRHPPGQTPPCPVHAGIYPLLSACWDTHTPLPSACWDTATCPVHAEIHATPSPNGHCSGRYASYWNAFLFHVDFPVLCTNQKNEFHLIWEKLMPSSLMLH